MENLDKVYQVYCVCFYSTATFNVQNVIVCKKYK